MVSSRLGVCLSASEMTYIVSGGALNSTHSLVSWWLYAFTQFSTVFVTFPVKCGKCIAAFVHNLPCFDGLPTKLFSPHRICQRARPLNSVKALGSFKTDVKLVCFSFISMHGEFYTRFPALRIRSSVSVSVNLSCRSEAPSPFVRRVPNGYGKKNSIQF